MRERGTGGGCWVILLLDESGDLGIDGGAHSGYQI